MTSTINYKILNWLIALVWFVNGLFCKVLNLVPRHQEIVSRISGSSHSTFLTQAIGVLEILMAIWILSGFKTRINALTQVLIIGTMNIIEFLVAPDLLLWGKANIIFAFMFILLICYKEFFIHKKDLQL